MFPRKRPAISYFCAHLIFHGFMQHFVSAECRKNASTGAPIAGIHARNHIAYAFLENPTKALHKVSMLYQF